MDALFCWQSVLPTASLSVWRTAVAGRIFREPVWAGGIQWAPRARKVVALAVVIVAVKGAGGGDREGDGDGNVVEYRSRTAGECGISHVHTHRVYAIDALTRTSTGNPRRLG